MVPSTPPSSSDAATMEAARAMSKPLYWVRKEVPHSRMVKRMTYTQKSAMEMPQMMGLRKTIFERNCL